GVAHVWVAPMVGRLLVSAVPRAVTPYAGSGSPSETRMNAPGPAGERLSSPRRPPVGTSGPEVGCSYHRGCARDHGRPAGPRRRRGGPRLLLAVRVAALTPDLVLVLVDDRSEAARVDDVRRDFVANVSHELKTPVGALSLLAEAVEGAADDPEAVQRFGARM